MRKILFALSAILLTGKLFACDVCGCSASGDGWGIMPNYNRHFVGMRFQARNFGSHHPGSEYGSGSANDWFLRTDLVGRIALHERWQLLATIPYRTNYRIEEGKTSRYNGLGDVMVQGQFLVIQPSCSDWKHALQINAGVETPTGKFTFNHNIPSMLQPGSGTWDFLGGANYTLRYRSFGFYSEATYRHNGTTTSHYKWGDTYNTSGRFFYTIEKSGKRWMPWLGAAYEHYDRNTENTLYDLSAAYTGGYVIPANAGLDLFAEGFALSLEAGVPLKQYFSDGYSKMNSHFALKFIYFIPQKTKTNAPE